jgi:hypothetical protein
MGKRNLDDDKKRYLESFDRRKKNDEDCLSIFFFFFCFAFFRAFEKTFPLEAQDALIVFQQN